MLGLWGEAAAPIPPLAWKLTYATQKKTKKQTQILTPGGCGGKKKKKNHQKTKNKQKPTKKKKKKKKEKKEKKAHVLTNDSFTTAIVFPIKV